MTPRFSEAEDIIDVLAARHRDAFSFLGLHEAELEGEKGWVSRVFRPDAAELKLAFADGTTREAEKVSPEGFFETWIPGEENPGQYGLAWTTHHGVEGSMSGDPYCFGTILGEQDTYFFSEGRHRRLYDHFGAHPKTMDGVEGTTFVVWAPNARRVSIVGDFNHWDGRYHLMRNRMEAGVWEIFIPGIPIETHYKFEIVTSDNQLTTKSDPFAFYSQCREQTASLTWDYNHYEWNDAEWMQTRRDADPYSNPVSIYEVHLGSWARVPEEGDRHLTYREFADKLVKHVKDMGFTHIELMPVSEFPFDGSWGYQVTGYYAPTSRFGNPDDFRYFVDVCHQNGIGVLLDWVPAHFPKDAHGLARFDGTCLYEHSDPKEGEHKDWGTLIFNFGRNEVRNFLVANALFWLDHYHIDGLRVDAVASMLYRDYSRKRGEWVPNRFGGRENLEAIDFLKEVNTACYEAHPGIMMMAEESTAFAGVSRPVDSGGLGFGFKWNMGWMHDSLLYISKQPVHRKYHHDTVTFSMIYAYDENFVLVLSHDEVVHGKRSLLDKMPGDNWQKFANLRMFLAWMYAHPGKKLLFQGAEVAPFTEWNFEHTVDWHLLKYPEHRGVRDALRDINHLYKDEPALHQMDHDWQGFEWVVGHDHENSVFAFLRKPKEGQPVLCVINATPLVRESYRIGVPHAGYWMEILNTDAACYAGSNHGNSGGVQTTDNGCHGRPHSLDLKLPPLSTMWFKLQ